jgi:muramoyltetrapeptide carboxypeptidase LdcA involved in peptidoglycan recycling
MMGHSRSRTSTALTSLDHATTLSICENSSYRLTGHSCEHYVRCYYHSATKPLNSSYCPTGHSQTHRIVPLGTRKLIASSHWALSNSSYRLTGHSCEHYVRCYYHSATKPLNSSYGSTGHSQTHRIAPLGTRKLIVSPHWALSNSLYQVLWSK